jgi:hypothetical protein
MHLKFLTQFPEHKYNMNVNCQGNYDDRHAEFKKVDEFSQTEHTYVILMPEEFISSPILGTKYPSTVTALCFLTT